MVKSASKYVFETLEKYDYSIKNVGHVVFKGILAITSKSLTKPGIEPKTSGLGVPPLFHFPRPILKHIFFAAI